MLFVGFAHNLTLEAYVSRVATITKAHTRVGADVLAALADPRALMAAFSFACDREQLLDAGGVRFALRPRTPDVELLLQCLDVAVVVSSK